MIRKSLLLKLFEASYIQRWNDQIRFTEFTELDKQAHKLIIAFVISKIQEEEYRTKINWKSLIEKGIFGLLHRIILTDLKPPLIYKIKENKKEYAELNKWVLEKINPYILNFNKDFYDNFKKYLEYDDKSIEDKIINFAHFFSSKWEFDLIKNSSIPKFLDKEIEANIKKDLDKYSDFEAIKTFNKEEIQNFINLCGMLRFQIRWSHLYRIPKTSVLGHMLIVAIYSYLFSLEANLSDENIINNFFTGLFHDFPEVFTRDIINPVKKSVEGLDKIIKKYEKQELERKILGNIPDYLSSPMRLYTEDEFEETPTRNGALIKACDNLAAFIEAYLAIKNGIQNEQFYEAKNQIKGRYTEGKSKICGIDFSEIFADFE